MNLYPNLYALLESDSNARRLFEHAPSEIRRQLLTRRQSIRSVAALDAAIGEMVVETTVEEEVYPLTDDETQPMYYYDLYYGPAELLGVAFGAWTPEMAAALEMEENA